MFGSRESLFAFEPLETSFPQAKTTKSNQQSGGYKLTTCSLWSIWSSISRSEVSGVSEKVLHFVLWIAGPVMMLALCEPCELQ